MPQHVVTPGNVKYDIMTSCIEQFTSRLTSQFITVYYQLSAFSQGFWTTNIDAHPKAVKPKGDEASFQSSEGALHLTQP